ncbi:IS110 family transposase, partial [Rhodococcus ruber]|nr:IS110 family transposase [Rhodococcus ruber]
IREQLRDLTTVALIDACAALRPTAVTPGALTAAIKTALRSVARRIQLLDTDIKALDKNLAVLIDDAAEDLVGRFGVGY